MDSKRQIEIPHLIRRAAQETVRGNETIEAVLLVGSRARGDDTGESDYDIAIITGPGSKDRPRRPWRSATRSSRRNSGHSSCSCHEKGSNGMRTPQERSRPGSQC